MKTCLKKFFNTLYILSFLAVFFAGLTQNLAPVAAQESIPETGKGFRGEYFSNTDLSGSPSLVRIDPNIDFNWGENSPGAGIPSANFSVRWVGNINFEEDTYRFTTKTDDGVRLYVDNNLLIDKWSLQNSVTHFVDQQVKKGVHTIKMEYFEGPDVAIAAFFYQLAPKPTPTPTTIPPLPATPPVGNVGVGTTPPQPAAAKKLPETGLPPLAWAIAIFIPIGLKMKKFAKIKGDLEGSPNHIWEEREFKSSESST